MVIFLTHEIDETLPILGTKTVETLLDGQQGIRVVALTKYPTMSEKYQSYPQSTIGVPRAPVVLKYVIASA